MESSWSIVVRISALSVDLRVEGPAWSPSVFILVSRHVSSSLWSHPRQRYKDTALSDQRNPATYTLHGTYYLKDRDGKTKV